MASGSGVGTSKTKAATFRFSDKPGSDSKEVAWKLRTLRYVRVVPSVPDKLDETQADAGPYVKLFPLFRTNWTRHKQMPDPT
jgi:hypothetical protein